MLQTVLVVSDQRPSSSGPISEDLDLRQVKDKVKTGQLRA